GHADAAAACEDCGYSGFYPSDHLMPVVDRGGDQDRLDAPSTLLALSGLTRRIRLGCMVQANLLRHPVITAMSHTTLDHASNGRAVLGIGAGGNRREYDIHGFPYPDTVTERIERLDEAVALIKTLWTNDRATFEGKYYQLHDAPFFPKPIQKPHPPIMVGGTHPGTMRVAAKYADEWNGLGSVKRVQALLDRMREICQEVGRDFASLTFSTQGAFLLTEDKAEAQKFIDRQVSHMTANPNFKLVDGYSSPDEQARDSHFVGGVGELTDLIGRWQEIGVTHVNFNTPRPFTRVPLETFAAKVMPAFS
ncbi:MAG TPA: LLM class flavin-dependent oxidoreductase, partial [Chloroflexota bacterium]|nr:LLM class flavin-dependent oxidoreductase [Chloroflexota bacterium]